MDELISKKQAAALLGVSTRTIDRWTKLGIFCRALKLPGGAVRFWLSHVEDWAKNLPSLSRHKPVVGCWPGPDLEPDETPASEADIESAED